MSAQEKWEELRKRARSLETGIDSDLVALNKLATSSSAMSIRSPSPSSNDKFQQKQVTFDALVAQLESQMDKLTQLNDQMSDLTQSTTSNSWSTNPALQHTVRRHREILRDYCIEFRRSKDTVQAEMDRERLLSSNTITEGLNNRGRSTADSLYLREHDHISSCDRLLDEQISIAMATKENVHGQRLSLRDISKKMNALTKRYPAINSLMHKIQMKKRKDTIIVAAVIASCLIFLFIYLWH